jgi:rhodanese-related sulfurtransferase
VSAVTVDDMLSAARERIERLDPAQTEAAMRDGALLVDIRAESQRARDGVVPGAMFIARNVFEWRMDPACEHREPAVGGAERQVVVMCDAGYQSSLAAAALCELGFTRPADLDGGFQAWRAAGLPVEPLRS